MSTMVDSCRKRKVSPIDAGTSRRRVATDQKIGDKSAMHVTFTKRRAGLFSMAADLCILCGVRMAVVVTSPGGRPYSFGSPSAEAVINHFLDPSHPLPLAVAGDDTELGGLLSTAAELRGQVKAEVEKRQQAAVTVEEAATSLEDKVEIQEVNGDAGVLVGNPFLAMIGDLGWAVLPPKFCYGV